MTGTDGERRPRAAREWEPEVEVSPERARALIERQFAAACRPRTGSTLTARAPLVLGAGWDNIAFLVDDAYVFRFPRRRVAAELITNEARILPPLRRRLPVPISAPEVVGVPDDGYPFPFAGYRLLPGVTADRAALDDVTRARLAPAVGAFLRALHESPVPEGAPGDVIGRTDVARRRAVLEERLLRLGDVLEGGVRASDVRALLDDTGSAAKHEGPPRLVHGDLYARHLLVDGGALAGVIDWGDVHAGDPALDLSLAFSFFSPDARAALFDAYGAVLDDDTLARARFRAASYGVVLLDYARATGDDALRGAARDALVLAFR